LRSVVQFILPP